jgi:hypothetical protein
VIQEFSQWNDTAMLKNTDRPFIANPSLQQQQLREEIFEYQDSIKALAIALYEMESAELDTKSFTRARMASLINTLLLDLQELTVLLLETYPPPHTANR